MDKPTEAEPTAPRPERSPLRACILVSAALLGLRLHLAERVGFGDAEALYATYALYPQPGYLDHPGLIGAIARFLGSGSVPDPVIAHRATAVLATLVPWVGGLAALAAGATRSGAARTIMALLLVPEIAIGLFGLTPDLPLALFWLAALGAGALALRSDVGSRRAFLATVGLGAAAAFATLSKTTGALLLVCFVVAWLGPQQRPRLRTIAPWAALATAGILLSSWIAWEWSNGLPMFRHRLIDSQAEAGLSLRNLGALIGGQLLYVTPPFLIGAYAVARSLFRERRTDAVSRFLWLATLVPGVPLLVLCAWSRVAEPHWLAPAYLALAVQLSRMPPLRPLLTRVCAGTGLLAITLGFLWVATDLPPRLLGESYRPRYDLSNDLFAWAPAGRMLDEAVGAAMMESATVPFVVGPHWIVCAQAQAHLGHRVRVGCNGPGRDDFDRWLPRERWFGAPSVLYVHDSRFEVDPLAELPGRVLRRKSRVEIRRGGKVVRTVWVTHLEKTEEAARAPRSPHVADPHAVAGAVRESPALSSRSESARGSGLSVVSSRSP